MPDQFDKTISSVSDDYAHISNRNVRPTQGVQGKKVDPKRSTSEKYRQGGGGTFNEYIQQYSKIDRAPDRELWNELIEAVRIFNKRQDIIDAPFEIRIWAQNDGVRVQLIHDLTGRLIKQTKIIPFAELTQGDINDIINDLASERGIVIDYTR